MKLASMVCAVMVGATCPIAKAETATLRLGLIASSMHDFSETVFDVAREKGMFDRQSLAITFVPLGGVDHMITALDDDSVDLSSTATPYLVKGELRGSDAVAVVGGPANTIYHLVSRPDIASFAGLKGKTIGLSLPVDVISVGARKLLAKHGLASSDYDSKQLVGTPVRATCLKDGECAATPLTQPVDFQFEKAGYHFLGSSQEAIPPMQFTMIAARRSWADQHKDLVVRFARAMGEAYAYMHDPANRATVIAMATKTTGASGDLIEKIYDLYYSPDSGVMPKHAEIDVQGVANLIQLLGGVGELKPPLPTAQRVVDLQFLQAAEMQ